MAATTPVYGFPYQELGDTPNGAALGQDLAEAIEDEITRVDADIAKINNLTSVRADDPTDDAAYSGATWIPGANVCAVAFTAPASGEVMVYTKAYFQSVINDKAVFVDTEVRTGATLGGGTVVSGGTANSNDGIALSGSVTTGVPLKLNAGTFKRVTGLTPGNSYNARFMYVTETGGNITVFYKQIVVVPQL